MQRIELKINVRYLLSFFVFFLVFSSLFLLYLIGFSMILFALLLSFSSTVIITGAIAGIIYFSQKKVVLTDNEIKKIGYPDKSIAYEDIEKIRVGMGSFGIYDDGKGSINITTFYTNFDAAKELLNKKITDFNEIRLTGFNRYIKKYLDVE